MTKKGRSRGWRHGLVALALAGAAGAGFAQQPPGPMGPAPMGPGAGPAARQQMTPEQWRERMQQRHEAEVKRVEGLLHLRPEQRAAWEEFVAAWDKHREQFFSYRWDQENQRTVTALGRLQQREEALTAHLEAVRGLREAVQKFYIQLDDAQRDVFDREFLRWGKGPKGGGPRPR
ncbi:MAG: Spy/CpxP family protein refolding chaperone [Rhodocyclales bacterium]|nr:Spy/CpxP family protein refolding chaperone [Rhodocyclales bacterium]